MDSIAIVSCNNWKDKLFEDQLLKRKIIENGYSAEIISWEEEKNFKKYDKYILRSIWGYQNKYLDFKKWLNTLKENNKKVFNNVDIVLNNIKKDKQFEILFNNKIPTVETIFIDDYTKINNYKGCVVKPSISGSGENTFLINDENSCEISKIFKGLLQENGDLKIMVQPFIKGINNGEYSVIFINGILSHTMIRYPGIFSIKKRPELVKNPPLSVIKLAKKVSKIKDFDNYLYMRADIVLENNNPIIMEIELTDPDLMTKYIDSSRIQDKIMELLIDGFENK